MVSSSSAAYAALVSSPRARPSSPTTAAPGPTGLLPEQYDPVAERSLGNHPQAYSHLGLIRCALLLDGALG